LVLTLTGVLQAAIAGGGEEEEGAGQAPGLLAGSNREVRVVRVWVSRLMSVMLEFDGRASEDCVGEVVFERATEGGATWGIVLAVAGRVRDMRVIDGPHLDCEV
jgi:hypothetical protein